MWEKPVETIALQSHALKSLFLVIPASITSDWLSYSSNITNPVGRDAEAFAIINDLTLVISEPTCVPDRAGDKGNTLDLFAMPLFTLHLFLAPRLHVFFRAIQLLTHTCVCTIFHLAAPLTYLSLGNVTLTGSTLAQAPHTPY